MVAARTRHPLSHHTTTTLLCISVNRSSIVAWHMVTKVVQSFHFLLDGVAVSRSSEDAMVRAVCTQVRGDWKWQKDPGLQYVTVKVKHT